MFSFCRAAPFFSCCSFATYRLCLSISQSWRTHSPILKLARACLYVHSLLLLFSNGLSSELVSMAIRNLSTRYVLETAPHLLTCPLCLDVKLNMSWHSLCVYITVEASTLLAILVADTDISFARDSTAGLHWRVLPTLLILVSHYGPLVYTLVCESFMYFLL